VGGREKHRFLRSRYTRRSFKGDERMKRKQLTALFAAVLGLGLLTGCKDLFHSEGDEDDNDSSSHGIPSNYTLAQSLAWLDSNVMEGGNYTITLRDNETIGPQRLYYGRNVNITLNGGTSERWIFLSSNGSLFTVESGITLTLDNNVTLQGRSDNTEPLVSVNNGGTLVLKDEAKISGNRASSTYGGGVFVNGGTFIMYGGVISGNSASHGGGVFGDYYGTFEMSGGIISDNFAIYDGGGVYVYNSRFAMNGGVISGNNTTFGGGGGVYVYNGEFMMTDGTINSNTTYGGGGGVYVYDNAFFEMIRGTISSNFAAYGGGAYINGGTFIKQWGGIIYGSGAGSLFKNTATNGDSYGHAVYVESGSKKRNTTADSSITLDSGFSGSAGGWE
jgi:hypothetical protein